MGQSFMNLKVVFFNPLFPNQNQAALISVRYSHLLHGCVRNNEQPKEQKYQLGSGRIFIHFYFLLKSVFQDAVTSNIWTLGSYLQRTFICDNLYIVLQFCGRNQNRDILILILVISEYSLMRHLKSFLSLVFCASTNQFV